MDVIGIDWLHQQEQDDWRRRIRQLHRELSQERMQAHKPQTTPQYVVDKDPEQFAKPLRRLKSSEYLFEQ